MTKLANQCPQGNTQEPMKLIIHGPTWKQWMPYDAHAMTVVVPSLLKHGWRLEANDKLNRLEIFFPALEAAP